VSSVLFALVVVAAIGAGPWLLSYWIEALRAIPKPPVTLRWAPDIPIQYVEVDGNKLRFITSGSGPVLVLLHTLRTQLDLFERVAPELSRHFTVYALDLPGHGYSDIPAATFDAEFFAKAVEGFLDKLDLRDVTLAGVSIGGSISLILAARHNPRVARVVAINPYDYAKGRGLARSSLLGWVFNYVSLIPVIGETVMRLRMAPVVNAVFRDVVVNADSISPALMREMYLVGNRPGHYRALIALLRNSQSWETAIKGYGRINVPVVFIWGSEDWARSSERQHDQSLVPGAQAVTVAGGGHFLPLNKPEAVISHLKDFAIRSR
jgi:pimeloyl-ACP methyl ester carboxylesterase